MLSSMTRPALPDILECCRKLPEPPLIDEELFEWIAVVESVVAARSKFTMLELGAGYGRWTARAAAVLRLQRAGLPMQFVAVEAEPTHFEWLGRHLKERDIDRADCKLIQAPVSGKREIVYFTVGHAEEWYGQAIIPSADRGHVGNWPNAQVVIMETVTIPDLIGDLDLVDLIDMDIQGAELACVENSIEVINKKVRRLFISTHSDEIHDRLLAVLGQQGWTTTVQYSQQRRHETRFGPMTFGDGIQHWINPRLS